MWLALLPTQSNQPEHLFIPSPLTQADPTRRRGYPSLHRGTVVRKRTCDVSHVVQVLPCQCTPHILEVVSESRQYHSVGTASEA